MPCQKASILTCPKAIGCFGKRLIEVDVSFEGTLRYFTTLEDCIVNPSSYGGLRLSVLLLVNETMMVFLGLIQSTSSFDCVQGVLHQTGNDTFMISSDYNYKVIRVSQYAVIYFITSLNFQKNQNFPGQELCLRSCKNQIVVSQTILKKVILKKCINCFFCKYNRIWFYFT